jgi:predicted TIM-barrel fold metal-dependent hydrolase
VSLPVIDVCGSAYDAESWHANLLQFAHGAQGYLHFFGPMFAQQAGVAYDQYAAALARSPVEAVELLKSGGGMGTSPQKYAAWLEGQGVRHQVLFGTTAKLGDGTPVNDRVCAFARTRPDLFTAWAALDLANPKAAAAELSRCVETKGARGATMLPFAADVDLHGPGCREIYGRATELKVPLWIHTGMNFASNRPLASSTWMDIDRIAMAFPKLTILAGHGGWPWIIDAMAVMQRHRNVYLEFSAHRPKLMGRTGSGWEPLLFYGRTLLREQVLFGSAGFVQKQTVRELADEVSQFKLGDDVTRAWLHDNAARMLGLEVHASTKVA